MPYERAAEVLERVGQIGLSASSLWQWVQDWGERFGQVEAAECVAANPLPDREEIIAGESRQAGRRMAVAMDGTMVPLRGEGWKELKVACVSQVEVRPGIDPQTGEAAELGHSVQTSYVCHLGGPEPWGKKAWSEAKRRDWGRAIETWAIGDAAAWIWNVVGEYFFDSQQLVDDYHALEHLARMGNLLYGEGTSESRQWLNRQDTSLFQGQAARMADQVVQLADKCSADIAEQLRTEAGYFRNHARRMNYLEMREAGWPIGSGTVESGGKQFKARFAGPGMRWSRPGAEHLLPIRSAILSRRFDAVWTAARNSPPS